jgi:hypothetical protein
MMPEVAHTNIQLKRKLQLPKRTLLILDGFCPLVVHFTTMRWWMVLHGVLLEYLFLGSASKDKGHGWKQAGRGLQGGS